MDDSYDALPPYPGFAFPAAGPAPLPGASPVTGQLPPGYPAPGYPAPGYPAAGYPAPGYPAPGSPPTGPSRRRPWLGGALGAGAVLLAAGAFLLGRGTARPASSSIPTATALSALGAATTPANPACDTPRRITPGTLKSVSGSTLTVTTPSGSSVTVKTDGNTKISKVVKGALSDVTKGATVAVHGTASGTSAIAADQVAIIPTSGTTPALKGPAGRPFGPKAQAAGIAIGTVQSVSGSGFTVLSGGTTVTVTTSTSTAFSKTVSATVADLTVGQPIAVGGTPNSDGSITAAIIEQAGAGTLGKLPGFGIGPGPGVRGHLPFGPGTTLPAGSGSGTP